MSDPHPRCLHTHTQSHTHTHTHTHTRSVLAQSGAKAQTTFHQKSGRDYTCTHRKLLLPRDGANTYTFCSAYTHNVYAHVHKMYVYISMNLCFCQIAEDVHKRSVHIAD